MVNCPKMVFYQITKNGDSGGDHNHHNNHHHHYKNQSKKRAPKNKTEANVAVNGKSSPPERIHKTKYCTLEEMPDYLRFNPWILNGYRSPNLTTMQCFRSIISWHNETINIMSHVLPIVYLIFNLKTLFGQHLFRSYLTYCHLVSCFSSWIGSLCYHIFMNHRQGPRIYQTLLRADMLGIWITQTFGALTTIQASLIEYSADIRMHSVIIYLMLSLYALYKGLTARKSWQRPFSFALLFLVRVLCFIARIRINHDQQRWPPTPLTYVIGQEIWPIIGAIISVSRVPERFFPGKFDLFLNSHNIMHCLVVFGGMNMHWAFIQDIQYFL